MKFTTSQQQAINIRGKNLLISASAGTGKTTVMIKRIIDLVLEKSISLDNILVVTFTTAAASQMKEKLRKALMDNSNNDYVFSQLEKLDTCSVSTLHSFCGDILRNYFYVVDIDPAYDILDPMISDSVRVKALDDILGEYYGKDDELFGRVCQAFHAKRSNSKLKKIVLKLYEFSRCQVNFAEWYQHTKANYINLETGIYAQTINHYIVSTSNFFADKFDEYAVRARGYGAKDLADYMSATASSYRLSEEDSLRMNIENIFDYKAAGNFTKKLKNCECLQVEIDEFDNFIALIERTKKKTTEFYSSIKDKCPMGYDQLLTDTTESFELIDKLVEITLKFSQRYLAVKKEKGVLDFNDLEHFTLKILQNDEARAEIRNKYQMVFVDEYQDINSVQEAIIRGVSVENNLFMVGDVKQSIYGFRQTNPDIFVEKTQQFATDSDSVVINLNDNFRSDKAILKFVNQIFTDNMTYNFGKIDYKNTAILNGDKNNSTILPKISINFLVKEDEKEDAPTDKYDITKVEKINSLSEAQADLIVKRIRKLVGTPMTIDGITRTVDYGDIAILVRDMKDASKIIYDRLKANDIPVYAEFNEEVLTKECLDLINFLRVIDNPYNDIYLAGICMSHFGGLSQNDLAIIKIQGKDKQLLNNLREYKAKDDIGTKISMLLQLIDTYRELSYSLTVDALLQKLIMDKNIYRGQSYLLYVQGLPNGQLRYSKLTQMLWSITGDYAHSISKYLQHIDQDKKLWSATNNEGDVVNLTTIHKSKGLEYPIVIGASLGKNFNHDYEVLPCNKDIGFALEHYDFSMRTKSNTLSYWAIDRLNIKREREEELRLLYVLLTRAKCQLSLYGIIKENDIVASEQAKCMADWINNCQYAEQFKITKIDDDERLVASTISDSINTDCNFIEKQLEYVYPYLDRIKTPAKVIASKITYDQDDEDAILPQSHVIAKDDRASEIGTAYHKLYEKLKPNADKKTIETQIASMVKSGVIGSDIAQIINVDIVHNGLNNSELLDIIGNGKIYHEIPFMLKTKYNEIYIDSDNDSDILLQGIIDMLVVKEDKAIVLDFKYTSYPQYIKRNYTPQLTAYALATKKILHLDTCGYILSIKDNQLIKIL